MMNRKEAMAIAHDEMMRAQAKCRRRVRQETIEKCAKVAAESSMCSSGWLAKWERGMDVRAELMAADERIAFCHGDWIAEQIRALIAKEE
ncbi:MAG: hypothetical protein ACXQT4_01645 [Methanotrichaceae archaeon]